eukprot:gene3198-biopygen4856
MRFGSVVLLLLAVCSLQAVDPAKGQGYRPGATVMGAAKNPYDQLRTLYSSSRAWKQVYKLAPAAACSSHSKASLCAAKDTHASDDAAQLQMATSPSAYSSINPLQVGNIRLVAAAGDQLSCQSCVAFAVTSAAETAMAAVLGVPVDECSMSVQGLHFCDAAGPVRNCGAGWTLQDALRQVEQRSSTIPTATCLPYKPDEEEQLATPPEVCKGSCSYANDHASEGRFSSKLISSLWEAQQHIRWYGAVVTRFDVFSDFYPFFDDYSKVQAVYRPGKNVTLKFHHAVVLVGYNNDHNPPYWIAKNSWGPGWGDNGFFKVAFDTCSVLTGPAAEAYGLYWRPHEPSAAWQLQLTSAAPAHPDCFWYKAKGTDYLSRVAGLAGIPLAKFMLDNTATVKDLDAPLAGVNLLLCGLPPGRHAVTNNNNGSRSGTAAAEPPKGLAVSADPQLESLLEIKKFIDKAGMLKDWDREFGQGKGYCREPPPGGDLPMEFPFRKGKWHGVYCSTDRQVVVQIILNNYNGNLGLQGQLPPASAFQGLPGLRLLDISDQRGLVGTLPQGWYILKQLEVLRLAKNSLSGSLPPAWLHLRQLTMLLLSGNRMSGPLPYEYKALTSLNDLSLGNNSLTGTVPPSWASMNQLEEVNLWGNANLSGCLPNSWKQHLVKWDVVKGTGLKGFCQ